MASIFSPKIIKTMLSIFVLLLLSLGFLVLPVSEVRAEGYFIFNNNLKVGTTYKVDAKELQNFLGRQGYNVGTADGNFGPKTKAQVILFQTNNGLTSDGSVGPITRGYINRLQDLLPPNPNPVVTPPVTPPITPPVVTPPTPSVTPLNRTLKLSMAGSD